MRVFIIEYFDDTGHGDCYPDFCYSRAEAERIAPEYAKTLDWAKRWEIREEHTD